MRLHHAHRYSFSTAAVIALLCILTSCGTSSAPTQTSPSQSSPAASSAASSSPSPSGAATEACADVAALKSSLEALTKVKPLQDGVPALTTAIDNVKTNLDKAEASASEALQPDVQQVKTAFAQLQTAASGLTASNLKEKAPAIATALAQVAAATKALSAALAEACPGS
jgi:hypothetical protein